MCKAENHFGIYSNEEELENTDWGGNKNTAP